MPARQPPRLESIARVAGGSAGPITTENPVSSSSLEAFEFEPTTRHRSRATTKIRSLRSVARLARPQRSAGSPAPSSVEQAAAQVLFNRVDKDGSGLISFDEFIEWWSRKQLATGGTLDNSLIATIHEQWAELDMDGSGDLNQAEFDVLMSELAKSEWREAVDEARGKVYFYNTRTKETRWHEPDSDSIVTEFMHTANLTVPATSKPPALDTLRRPLPRRPGRSDPSVTTKRNSPEARGESVAGGGAISTRLRRAQPSFEPGAQMLAMEHSIPVRKSPRKGSDHVIELGEGDAFQIKNVLTDEEGTLLQIETITVKGRPRAKTGWIRPLDRTGRALIRPMPMPTEHVATSGAGSNDSGAQPPFSTNHSKEAPLPSLG
eukprot:COSAG02_NODE_5331_length_4431_cov_4.370729_2_plen_377_part_00